MFARQVANLLPKPVTRVNGNPHLLAYITPEEASLLASRGGGAGRPPGAIPVGGVPAFDDSDSADGPSGPGQGDDGGYGGWGGGFDGPSGPGQGDDAGYGGWGGGGGDPSASLGGEGGNTSGASDDSGYGMSPPSAQVVTPEPAAPPRDLAGEAEARVRQRFAGSTGDLWMKALRDRFQSEAQDTLNNAYTSRRTDIRDRLMATGYDATPIASFQLSGLDAQRNSGQAGIGSTWTQRETDYRNRINTSLAQAIAEARAGQNPDAAEGIADRYVGSLNDGILANPGAAYSTGFGPMTPLVATAPDAQRREQAMALQNALTGAGLPQSNRASMVGG
jgi:hypothetical protein